MGAPPELKTRLGLAVFEHAPCLVALLDEQLRIVAANAAVERLFGRRGEGEHCYQLFKGRASPCEVCVAAQVLADGQDHRSEEQGQDSQARPLIYQVQALPADGPDGQGRYVLQLGQDVTALREAERGLAQTERLATVGMTTAGLAHTIKNILAGLEGGCYVLESGLQREDSGRIKGGWSMVQKYIEQITALVKNLLSYARAETPTIEPVDLAELVSETVELYASKAELVGIVLEAELAEDLEPLPGERQGLTACLGNLVTNALDACTWDPDEDKTHRVAVRARPRPGGGVILEVEDNGMGIAEEHQAKVLRSSFTTKGIRGTGLGLLLTRKKIEEHGGTMSFRSTPGQGTTFVLELPGDEAAPAGGPEVASPGQPTKLADQAPAAAGRRGSDEQEDPGS